MKCAHLTRLVTRTPCTFPGCTSASSTASWSHTTRVDQPLLHWTLRDACCKCIPSQTAKRPACATDRPTAAVHEQSKTQHGDKRCQTMAEQPNLALRASCSVPVIDTSEPHPSTPLQLQHFCSNAATGDMHQSAAAPSGLAPPMMDQDPVSIYAAPLRPSGAGGARGGLLRHGREASRRHMQGVHSHPTTPFQKSGDHLNV